jgi:DNA repair protein RadC
MNTASVQTFAFSGGDVVRGVVKARLMHGPATVEIAGLPERAGNDTARRVRAVFNTLSLALPPKRVSVHLLVPFASPDGRHFDLAIVLAVLCAMGVADQAELDGCIAFGGVSAGAELCSAGGWPRDPGLDSDLDLQLICPADCRQPAYAAGFSKVLATEDLMAVINQLKGGQLHDYERPARRDAAVAGAVPRSGRAFSLGSWLPGWLTGRPADGTAWEDFRAPAFAGGFADGPGVRKARASKIVVPQEFHPPTAAAEVLPFKSTGPQGHRQRMREKVLTRGTDALADYELLETLLFLAFKTGDTKPIAKAVINRFGSFAKVLSATERELLETPGLGPHAVSALKIVQASAVRLARAELMDQPIIDNWSKLMAYLNVVMGREPTEQFRVLFLDNRNRLLADEAQSRGTVNHTPVYPREVVKRALELHATALILAHNHPSGDPTPSDDDLAMTREIKNAAQALTIVIHDHVIVGNGKWFSLRKERLL